MTNTIKNKIWKITADLYGTQHDLVSLSKKNSFGIKDAGHFSMINVLVGEEQETYNSFVKANFEKKPKMNQTGKKWII